jgi:hypothetical protein
MLNKLMEDFISPLSKGEKSAWYNYVYVFIHLKRPAVV